MSDTKIYQGDMTRVNLLKNLDYNTFVKYTERKQELHGFDDKYLDIVDYIIKITHSIWEERGIGVIYDTYHNDCIVHTGDTSSAGIVGVISGTLSTLYSFPDRRLIGEDVIWSEDTPQHFYTSHRILSTATNLRDSAFGAATGKRISFRTIADCAITQNRIYEEWLVRDNLWIVKQLGFDPHEVAKKMAKGQSVNNNNKGVADNLDGQLYPKPYKANDESPGEQILEMHHNIFACKRIDAVKQHFSDNAVLNYVGNQELIGHGEIQDAFVSLLASLPNACHTVDRITVNTHDDGVSHVAVRFRLRGINNGQGYLGAPSGNPVDLLAISHYMLVDGKITEGCMIFDALDVLRQVYLGKETVCCE